MTLCELEVAHLTPPMECRTAKHKTTATPTDRRHCVEWVFPLSIYLHTILTTPGHRALARSAQSWSSYSGYFRESSELGSTCLLNCIVQNDFSSHVLCLPTAERYRYFLCHPCQGGLKRTCFHRYSEGHIPEYHGGETAPGPILTQAGTTLSKE